MVQQSINLYISRIKDEEQINLTDAVKSFIEGFGKDLPEKTFAVLYAPNKCHLAILQGQEFHDANGKVEMGPIFEARVFNDKAEMRWLNIASGSGKTVILCSDDSKKFFSSEPKLFKTKFSEDGKDVEKEIVDVIPQNYLLWGESVGASINDSWAQFAEARIGAFFVPISDDKISGKNKVRAMFTAIEYIGVYVDGNVAVAEERLTGIEIV